MHPMIHQEIARSRQADLLREARLAHLAAEVRAADPRPGLLERFGSQIARLPRRRVRRPVYGLAG